MRKTSSVKRLSAKRLLFAAFAGMLCFSLTLLPLGSGLARAAAKNDQENVLDFSDGSWGRNGKILTSAAEGNSTLWLRSGGLTDFTVELLVTLTGKTGEGDASLALLMRQDGSKTPENGVVASFPSALNVGAKEITVKAGAADLAASDGFTGLAADTAYVLKAVVSGSAVKLYVDGELKAEGVNDAYASGRFGLLARSAAVAVTNFKVTPGETDGFGGFTFERGDDTSPLELSGGWIKRDGKLCVQTPSGNAGIYVKNSEGYTDSELTFDVTFTNANANVSDYNAFSIATRQVGDHQQSNEINFEFNADGFTGLNIRTGSAANTAVSLDPAGVEEKLGSALALGTKYSVKVVAAGDVLTLFLDGVEILKGTGMLCQTGKTGLVTWQLGAEVDNFKVVPQDTTFAVSEDFTTLSPYFDGVTAESNPRIADGVLNFDRESGNAMAWLKNSGYVQDSIIEFDLTFTELGSNGYHSFAVMTRYNAPDGNWQKSNHIKFEPNRVAVCRQPDEGNYQEYGNNGDRATDNSTGKSYRIRIETIGTSVRVFYDGALKVEANGVQGGFGQIGFCSWFMGVTVDHFSVTPAHAVYAEDEVTFRGLVEDGTGWKVNSETNALSVTTALNADSYAWLNGAENMKDLSLEFDLAFDSYNDTPLDNGGNPPYASFVVELRSNGSGQKSNHVKFERDKIVFGRLNETYENYGIVQRDNAAGTNVHVKIELVGRFIKVYCDGALTAESAAFPESDYGSFLGLDSYNANVTLTNIRVSQPAHSFTFTDTDGRAEQAFELNNGWTFDSGKLYLKSTSGNNYAWLNDTLDWSDSTILMKVKILRGNENGIFSIVTGAPKTDDDEDYQLGNVLGFEFTNSETGMGFTKMYQGKLGGTVYGTAENLVSSGETYELMLVTRGGVMQFYVDNALVLTSENMPVQNGRIGFVGFNIGAEITELSVKHLPYDMNFAAEGIQITANPTKTEYIEGQTVDLAGIVATATFPDGTTCDLSEEQLIVTDAALDEVGTEIAVEVALKADPSIKTTFFVKVNAKQAAEFTITKNPDKTEYVAGEEVNLAGIEYTLKYDNDTAETGLTDVSLLQTGTELNGAGDAVAVTVALKSNAALTDTFNVKVVVKEISSIRVTQNPAKTEYVEGTAPDLTGIVVTATYNDATTGTLALSAIESDTVLSAVGDAVAVTVKLKANPSVTATFTVKVTAAKVVGVTITTPPTKAEYSVGESVDLTGIVIEATYDNGTTRAISASEFNVSADLSKENLASVVTLTLKTDESVKATFEIMVQKTEEAGCGCGTIVPMGGNFIFPAAGLLALAAGAFLLLKRGLKKSR